MKAHKKLNIKKTNFLKGVKLYMKILDFEYDKNRIEKLRISALPKEISYIEFFYHFYKKMIETGRQKTYEERYADAICESFKKTSVLIEESELIVGRVNAQALTEEIRNRWEEMSKFYKACPSPFGMESHMSVDYDMLLKKGINGIIEEIDGYEKGLDLTCEDGIKKHLFYVSCKRCLEGVVEFSERYAKEAEKQAESVKDNARKAELLNIAKICRRVPANPAESFYEAVQSVHFLTFCLSNKPLMPSNYQYQLGRPDRYLLKYYENDIKSGKITKSFAQTLLDCLGIQINHRVPNGLSSGYMVGGLDKNGDVVSNELTRMLMSVIHHVNLVYPSVGLCCCQKTPDEDISFSCEILAHGHSHPAFFNDDVISNGLIYYGVPKEDSREYIHSTCVEITPIAASNVWVASPYTNLLQKLLDVLDKEYISFDELLKAYHAHLSKSIQESYINQLKSRHERSQYSIDPLLSCFVKDCLKNGRDIEQGGARYNWIMPSFVGLSNAADSLFVINELIFVQKSMTFSKLKKMLENDFKGYEKERSAISKTIEKYGNDNDEADAYVKDLTQWLSVECEQYQKNDLKFIPSLFCWIMHDYFGNETGASPDGRQSGFPLGDGSGPAQGREHNGPTAAVLSSTKWSHEKFIGGVAVNMKFSKKLFGENSISALTAIIKTYLKRGGFEAQINVVDRETLLSAQKNPAQYSDLVVRIGGYSDYFTKLSPTMQAEVLQRTEYVV